MSWLLIIVLIALGLLFLLLEVLIFPETTIAGIFVEGSTAIAVDNEQEMKAKSQEFRAAVIMVEAIFSKAIAKTFRSGNFGIMDYYKFQKIQVDTCMRDSIIDLNQHRTGQSGKQGE